jgi:glutamate/tyrosine decarboxylase-like PLP-dependent enzyme
VTVTVTVTDDDGLALSREEMRRLGYRVIDALVRHFDELPRKPVTRRDRRAALDALLARGPGLSEEGLAPEEVIDWLTSEIFTRSMHMDHPRFFGFIPGPSNYVSALADALASGFNPGMATWLESSGPIALELRTVDWLRELVGFPETGGGLFLSGGSEANLTALVVARDRKLAERGSDGVVYCSRETHSSVERAIRILGLAPARLRKIPTDERFRISPSSLEEAVVRDRREGLLPFALVANAGTTSTGAVDPLAALAEIAARHGVWLHVDAAYGGATLLTAEGRERLAGIERADSVALDPHKWLFQPFETGCLLVRDRALLRRSFEVRPEYLKDAEGSDEEPNPSDYGLKLSRPFNALKLWLSLAVFGVGAFRRAVQKGLDRARTAEALLRDGGEWEIVTPAELGIVTFRFAPGDLALARERTDELQPLLVADLIADGFAFLSQTALDGRPVLRLCCINPRTTDEDLRETIRRLAELGRARLSA